MPIFVMFGEGLVKFRIAFVFSFLLFSFPAGSVHFQALFGLGVKPLNFGLKFCGALYQ